MNETLRMYPNAQNQMSRRSLATSRDSMEAEAVVKQYASRIVRSARGIGPRDRQWLYDLQRGRVALGTTIRLFELASTSELTDALWGPAELRGLLVREIQPALPCFTAANTDEELANHVGNLAQLALVERKSASGFQVLRGAMEQQAVVSQVLADVTALEERKAAQSIHVVSR